MKQELITSAELDQLIERGLQEAAIELRDQGITLSSVCETENGDSSEVQAFAKRLVDGELTEQDIRREKHIAAILGI